MRIRVLGFLGLWSVFVVTFGVGGQVAGFPVMESVVVFGHNVGQRVGPSVPRDHLQGSWELSLGLFISCRSFVLPFR